jgi:hypothetical protein
VLVIVGLGKPLVKLDNGVLMGFVEIQNVIFFSPPAPTKNRFYLFMSKIKNIIPQNKIPKYHAGEKGSRSRIIDGCENLSISKAFNLST